MSEKIAVAIIATIKLDDKSEPTVYKADYGIYRILRNSLRSINEVQRREDDGHWITVYNPMTRVSVYDRANLHNNPIIFEEIDE